MARLGSLCFNLSIKSYTGHMLLVLLGVLFVIVFFTERRKNCRYIYFFIDNSLEARQGEEIPTEFLPTCDLPRHFTFKRQTADRAKGLHSPTNEIMIVEYVFLEIPHFCSCQSDEATRYTAFFEGKQKRNIRKVNRSQNHLILVQKHIKFSAAMNKSS